VAWIEPPGAPVREVHGVDPQAIADDILSSTEPLLIRGLVAQWPAVRAARESAQAGLAYLRAHCRNATVGAWRGAPEIGGRFFYNHDMSGFNFEPQRLKLGAVLDELERLHPLDQPPALYVGSTTVDTSLPGFRDANDVALGDRQALMSIWIGNQTRIAAHHDLPDNLACVTAGRRRFTLFPPGELANLYIGPLDFTPAGQAVSLVDFAPPRSITWAYDLATQQWHKWLSWDQSLATFKRHRSNCHALFANLNLVGDYENGKIYSLQNEVYTEDGAPIRRLRRAPHLTADLQRQYFDELQIQFQPGVGLSGVSGPAWLDAWVLATEDGEEMLTTEAGVPLAVSVVETLGADPQAMLRWSNDGGSTWSSEHWTSIGKQGQYRNRAIWRRLGFARDRVFEVAVTDPVKCVIVSANLKASVGDN
jgi:hypothetical protein